MTGHSPPIGNSHLATAMAVAVALHALLLSFPVSIIEPAITSTPLRIVIRPARERPEPPVRSNSKPEKRLSQVAAPPTHHSPSTPQSEQVRSTPITTLSRIRRAGVAHPPSGLDLAANALLRARTLPHQDRPAPGTANQATAHYIPPAGSPPRGVKANEQRLMGANDSTRVRITRSDGSHYCLQAPFEPGMSQVAPPLATVAHCGDR